MIFQAKGNSNTRASISGHSFISSPVEQYIELNKNIFSIRKQNQTILDSRSDFIDLKPNISTSAVNCSLTNWYAEDASGNKVLNWNTSSGLELGSWTGPQIIKANRNIKFDGSAFGSHIILGENHLWVDLSGKLRIKNGQPTSDTDGTIVGLQT